MYTVEILEFINLGGIIQLCILIKFKSKLTLVLFKWWF